MSPNRESRSTDAWIIVGGAVMIGFAFLNLKYHVTGYAPGDIRGEPWFDPVVSLITAALGLLMIGFGSIRLIQAQRVKK